MTQEIRFPIPPQSTEGGDYLRYDEGGWITVDGYYSLADLERIVWWAKECKKIEESAKSVPATPEQRV